MPYISKEDKRQILQTKAIKNCGQLNYQFTQIILDYLRLKGECYQTYNDIIGALECCKLELYRRKIVPYEKKKKNKNGDVYLNG